MNIVCLNCEVVTQTNDPRKKFCNPVCRNRYNVRKSLSKPKKEVRGIDKLREIIKGIESKPSSVTQFKCRHYFEDSVDGYRLCGRCGVKE